LIELIEVANISIGDIGISFHTYFLKRDRS
jgi:hypothetical protein